MISYVKDLDNFGHNWNDLYHLLNGGYILKCKTCKLLFQHYYTTKSTSPTKYLETGIQFYKIETCFYYWKNKFDSADESENIIKLVKNMLTCNEYMIKNIIE